MGFYLRKSVNVGPFRVNFSNSGVGVSAGIKGLRVGTGPRGHHISVGAGALRYRASLPLNPGRGITESPAIPSPLSFGVDPIAAIVSAPIDAMQDNSSADLLAELRRKTQRPAYWKWTAASAIIAIFFSAGSEMSFVMPAVCFLGLGLTIFVGLRDTVAKTAVLCYQLDDANEEAFGLLHSAFSGLASCRSAWQIDGRGAVYDRKYHAGASSLVSRKGASFGRGLPPKMKCNLEVPFVKGSRLSLYFMPDRILLYSRTDVGAVSYKDIQFEGISQRFIEDGHVPSDAEIVDRTWKYVNKKGGPDKRFKDNRQLPIALYEELRFASSAGLNEVFQVSRHSISTPVHAAIGSMARVLPA